MRGLILFFSGSIAFLLIDRAIANKGGSYAQLMAMLLDFVPEALSLGAIFALDPGLGMVLAIFIGIQNLPESFNAYFELKKGKFTDKSIFIFTTVIRQKLAQNQYTYQKRQLCCYIHSSSQ